MRSILPTWIRDNDLIVVLTGNADGAFQFYAEYATESNAVAVAVIDLGNDGDLDFVSANSGFPNGISMIDVEGEDSERDRILIGNDTRSIIVGDFNGDGVDDIVAGHANGGSEDLTVLFGTVSGSLGNHLAIDLGSFSTTELLMDDLNGDDVDDLVAVDAFDKVALLINNGIGGFHAPQLFSFEQMAAAGLADMDGDGDVDLLIGENPIGTNDSIIMVQGNDGLGGFSTADSYQLPIRLTKVAVLDIDSDDDLELIGIGDDDSGTNSNRMVTLINQGAGQFDPPNELVGDRPVAISGGDFDADGNPDLVTANLNDGSLTWLLGNGVGGVQSTGEIVIGGTPSALVTAEINGDQHLDLVAADSSADQILVLLGDGVGGFSLTSTVSVGDAPGLC